MILRSFRTARCSLLSCALIIISSLFLQTVDADEIRETDFKRTPAPANDIILYVVNRDGRLVVDTTGHPNFAAGNTAIGEKLGIKEIPGEETVVVPENLLPKVLRVKSIQLLTRKGVVNAAVKEARFRWSPSQGTIFLVTDQPGTKNDPFEYALAKIGSTFPATKKLRLLKDSHSMPVSAFAGDAPAAAPLLKPLRSWLEKNISAEDRAVYDELKIEPSDFRFVDGNFGKKGKWLAWAESDKLASGAEKSFAFGAVLGEDGTILSTLHRPQTGQGDGIESWTPQMIADIDGDGVDEFVVQTMGYESWDAELYRYKDGAFAPTILSEDGT